MVRFLINPAFEPLPPAFEPPVHWVLISMLVVCRKGANGIALICTLNFSNILRLFPFYVHHSVSQVMFLTKQHTTEKVYQIDGCLCNTLSQVAVVLHEPKHYESTMSYRLTHCSLR